MKKISLLLLIICFFLRAQSQSFIEAGYEGYASKVRENVWSWSYPAFSKTTIPDSLNIFSSVILASREEISFPQDGYAFKRGNGGIYCIQTNRKRIKINDKSALDEFSELSFRKTEQRPSIWTKNFAVTVLGVRITKPDGTVKEVDVSKAVTIIDGKKSSYEKLAIPDLQIGDIIDYFFQHESQMYEVYFPMYFAFSNRSPMLWYSVHCEIDKYFIAEFKAINGTPSFSVETNNKKELILDAEQENIPAFIDELWISPLRQVPVLQLCIFMPAPGKNAPYQIRQKGTASANTNAVNILRDAKWRANNIGAYYFSQKSTIPNFSEIKNLVAKYKKEHPQSSSGETACFIYYAARHYLCNNWEDPDKAVDNNRNYYETNSDMFAIYFERLLTMFEIPCALGFVTEKYSSPSFNMINSMDGLDIIVMVPAQDSLQAPLFFVSPYSISTAGDIGPGYEGETIFTYQVLYYNHIRSISTGKRKDIGIPFSNAQQNKRTELINITFNNDMTDTNLEQIVTLAGNARKLLQQFLLIFEDYEQEERTMLGIEKTMFEEIKGNKFQDQKLVSEYKSRFADAKKEQLDYFKEVIKLFYDEEPTQTPEYSIINTGVLDKDSEMKYRIKFTMDGFVKKADHDYLVDIGKMAGSPTSLKEKERTRSVDIYISYAHCIEKELRFDIPQGYTVENIDRLAMNVKNQCGHYTVQPYLENNMLVVKISKEHSNAFEPKENWPQILEILDAATLFYNTSIILKNCKKVNE